MKAPKSTVKFHLVPAGTHHAVCFAVWNLGWQETTWQNKKMVKPQIMVAWETSETIDSQDEWAGQRYRVYKKYTFSMGEKSNLAKDIQGWLGAMTKEQREDFDTDVLIGQNCLINIVHKEGDEKTFVNIMGVSPVLKGMPNLVPQNKTDEPDWVKAIIAKAVEPPEDHNSADEVVDENGKGIPF